jgi:hypothetical protein
VEENGVVDRKLVQGEFDFEKGGVKHSTKVEVPSVSGNAFHRWFNALTPEQIRDLWQQPEVRAAIEARPRSPGGFHEWLPVSRAFKFREWGITAEQIQKWRTPTSAVKWKGGGAHGGLNSTTMHNEIIAIADSSSDFATFLSRLRAWAERRLEGGAQALPPGLSP